MSLNGWSDINTEYVILDTSVSSQNIPTFPLAFSCCVATYSH